MRDDKDEVLDRRSRILDGARSAFLRFGFERTSMADIASGAGVSRTAVYHYFPGKEDVLRAVVDELHAQSLAAAKAALESSKSLNGALISLLEAKFRPTLAVLSASPHGAALVDAGHRLTGPATQEADIVFQQLLVTALERYGCLKEANATADTLMAASKGLMPSVQTPAPDRTFQDRLQRLVSWLTTD